MVLLLVGDISFDVKDNVSADGKSGVAVLSVEVSVMICIVRLQMLVTAFLQFLNEVGNRQGFGQRTQYVHMVVDATPLKRNTTY